MDPKNYWLIGAFLGADGIPGPPPPPVPLNYIGADMKYVGPVPPEGWTYAKDGYAFLNIPKDFKPNC